MQLYRPRNTQLESLPKELQAMGDECWQEFLRRHNPSSARQQELSAWLPWIFAISDFVAKVVLRYGEAAIEPMFRRQPGDHLSLIHI